jgi:hypothetical protein
MPGDACTHPHPGCRLPLHAVSRKGKTTATKRQRLRACLGVLARQGKGGARCTGKNRDDKYMQEIGEHLRGIAEAGCGWGKQGWKGMR